MSEQDPVDQDCQEPDPDPPPLPNATLPQVEPPALLVIGGFVIKGIDDDANRAHARLFYEQLLPMMQNSGPSWKLSTREKYDRIMDAMVRVLRKRGQSKRINGWRSRQGWGHL